MKNGAIYWNSALIGLIEKGWLFIVFLRLYLKLRWAVEIHLYVDKAFRL